jgi:hypothetical protein
VELRDLQRGAEHIVHFPAAMHIEQESQTKVEALSQTC